ncbi:hypothetical protein O7598_31215 [Micromonospora sp. WMMC241]|uniref:hypothetical protein n=1 Tax=Micromonospora sp. WMMC241 TaxID=3015159 RepID=UPI0022B68EAE|nr:hypothetical protein [Micromonospora sp. WMMC241]MCZ7434794.1 hypothetical protein [Micromonospora sp. WMMC241]MCZ7440849.1 hypothetical protein [Micromonospora sp. WMMC241]MCZ7440896.1 hypothetical protein [Micromonospora sp. WMMC241]
MTTDTVTPADIAAELMLNAARDIDTLTISERLDDTEMPDEPDGFAEQVAELVKTASISIDWPDTTDGTVNVGDGLVGALVAKLGQERDALGVKADDQAAELDRLRAQLAEKHADLHRAQAEIASHAQAVTHWANQVNELKTELTAMQEKAAKTEREQALVVEFNSRHLIGTPVRYWKGAREGEGRTSKTRTGAQMLSGHTAVVWVEDEGACIALSHIEPVETAAV